MTCTQNKEITTLCNINLFWRIFRLHFLRYRCMPSRAHCPFSIANVMANDCNVGLPFSPVMSTASAPSAFPRTSEACYQKVGVFFDSLEVSGFLFWSTPSWIVGKMGPSVNDYVLAILCCTHLSCTSQGL